MMDPIIVLGALRRQKSMKVLLESDNACGFELLPTYKVRDRDYRSRRFVGVYTPCVSYSKLCDDIKFQEQLQ